MSSVTQVNVKIKPTGQKDTASIKSFNEAASDQSQAKTTKRSETLCSGTGIKTQNIPPAVVNQNKGLNDLRKTRASDLISQSSRPQTGNTARPVPKTGLNVSVNTARASTGEGRPSANSSVKSTNSTVSSLTSSGYSTSSSDYSSKSPEKLSSSKTSSKSSPRSTDKPSPRALTRQDNVRERLSFETKTEVTSENTDNSKGPVSKTKTDTSKKSSVKKPDIVVSNKKVINSPSSTVNKESFQKIVQDKAGGLNKSASGRVASPKSATKPKATSGSPRNVENLYAAREEKGNTSPRNKSAISDGVKVKRQGSAVSVQSMSSKPSVSRQIAKTADDLKSAQSENSDTKPTGNGVNTAEKVEAKNEDSNISDGIKLANKAMEIGKGNLNYHKDEEANIAQGSITKRKDKMTTDTAGVTVNSGGFETNSVIQNNEAIRQNLLAAIKNKGRKEGGANVVNDTKSGNSSASKMGGEKKVTNIEREKLLLGLKERVLRDNEKKNSTMEQEKNFEFGEEIESKSEDAEKRTGMEDDTVPFEAGNMIDELQKYLVKKFGPIVPIKDVTDFSENSDSDKDVLEKELDTPDKEVIPKTDSESKDGKTNADTAASLPMKIPVPHMMLPHPIFFKTSVKKDPGSKLHDQLVQELGSVLRKREGKPEQTEPESKDDNGDTSSVNFPKRRVSGKGNKVLGNKALMASLENHLQRTLHKNKIFQRQRLKVIDFESIEVSAKEENESSETNTNTRDSNASVGAKSLSHKTGAKLIMDTGNILGNKSSSKGDDSQSPVSSPTSTMHSGISSQEVARHDGSSDSKEEDQELFVYAYEHPSGRTEGVVCTVERRQSTKDSLGRPRKYLTCINIVAEKSGLQEGCPFTQEVADGGMPSASGQGLFFAEEDKPAHFRVDVGRRKGDLRVSVSGPNSIAKCSVDPQADGSYVVTYIPVETGIFDINITWNDSAVPGSPYHPKVVDARKVKVIGGWQHFMDSNERVGLVVGEKKLLPFDIAEAGPGTLKAEVRGPTRSLDTEVDTRTMGKAVVEFIPEEEGSHYIHLFWSDIPLVNSPYHGFAIQQVPDASKLILTGRGLKEAVVREEAEFTIDGSQAGKGNPDVVLSGVRAEVNVKVQPLGNGKYRCTYIPTVPGAYLLHITWNGRQLRGSPYKVNVIGAFYPNRVVVSGEGLRGGILGARSEVLIDTRRAGPGELTAYCMGPHQVAFCELQDNKDGTFNLGIKSQEPGRHVLQVKYGGEHVQGSPFVFKVTAQPDASKVRVHGPGVEHGILATYVSRFIVETRGAGAGQLTVRIRGPKGAFQVEMYRDSQRDRTILCRFDPTECGLYIISVKWSGVNVPGSPFHLHILDTQEELEQVLNDVSYSINTSHSRSSSQHAPPQRMQFSQWQSIH